MARKTTFATKVFDWRNHVSFDTYLLLPNLPKNPPVLEPPKLEVRLPTGIL